MILSCSFSCSVLWLLFQILLSLSIASLCSLVLSDDLNFLLSSDNWIFKESNSLFFSSTVIFKSSLLNYSINFSSFLNSKSSYNWIPFQFLAVGLTLFSISIAYVLLALFLIGAFELYFSESYPRFPSYSIFPFPFGYRPYFTAFERLELSKHRACG